MEIRPTADLTFIPPTNQAGSKRQKHWSNKHYNGMTEHIKDAEKK